MLQVIPRKIDLKLFQRRYNVRLTNLSEMPFIFKVRTTNVNAFTVEPNVGFLRAQTDLSLLITVKSRNPFDQKIQIVYANITDPTMGYEQTWNVLQKQGITPKKETIHVCLNKEEESGGEEVEELSSSAYRTSQRRSRNKITPKRRQSIAIQYPSKKDRLSTIKEEDIDFRQYISTGAKINTNVKEQIIEHYERQKKRYYEDEEREELLYRVEEMERNYNNEINQSERLRQQLQIAEAKIRQSKLVGLKYQVDQSLGVICDEHHTSFTCLALIALTAFFFGYLFALLA